VAQWKATSRKFSPCGPPFLLIFSFIRFFDAYNYTQIHTWKSSSTLTGVIRVIAVNQAETLVAVGFSTGAISLIESRTGTLVASWKGGDSEITLVYTLAIPI
jgi:hypothetical protein